MECSPSARHKKTRFIRVFLCLAEGEGFEPSEPVKVRAISSRVLSSTQPPLRKTIVVAILIFDEPAY